LVGRNFLARGPRGSSDLVGVTLRGDTAADAVYAEIKLCTKAKFMGNRAK
jgi:hypothetical protein